MSKLGTVLKVGATVLAAVGGVAEVATVVENKHNETKIVEQYNYEQVHEINVFDTYKIVINGEEVEVSYDEFMSAKDNLDSQVTKTENNTIEVISEDGATILYGAVDSLDEIDLSKLTDAGLNGMVSTFSCRIECGNEETYDNQYPVIVIPEAYVIDSIIIDNILPQPMLCSNVNGYNIYYLDTPSYDICFGGFLYTLSISVAQ